MGSLKDDLKTAASLLKSGDNEKVIELLKSYEEDDSSDYRVLCFLALAYANTADYTNSYRIYKKAVEIDEHNPMAWKGLFKLFETESHVQPDQFSLKICDFIEKQGDDKKVAAASARRRIHVEMKLWPEIFTNFEQLQFQTDSENLQKIVEALKSSQNHQDILKIAFEGLENLNVFEKNGQLMLDFCKFTKSMESVIRFAELHSELVEDEFVQKSLLEYSCEEFFERNSVPNVAKFVKTASDFTLAVLKALRENDTAAALDALDAATDHSIYPDCLLFIGLLAESEHWEAVEIICSSIRSTPTSVGWIARSLLESGDREKVKSLGALKLPEFSAEQLKIHLLREDNVEVERTITEFAENSRLRLTKALFCQEPITDELVQLAEQLPKETCQDLVLAAEVRINAGLDANTLLVKAAKLNVRCSRAFYLIGKSISSKNSAKAKSLIERAVGIRPGNEEYVKALDGVLIRQNAPAADRLKILKELTVKKRNRQKPFWLAEALSILHLEVGNLTEAIDELQQMARLYKDHKTVWARLANAYNRKGHLRASVNSYAQLAEMENGHEFSIPMIRVLLQLREFDEALLKATELRQKIIDENLQCCSDSPIVLDFTEAEIRLNLHENTCGNVKKDHLKEALRLLTKCINEDGSCKYVTVFKLLGNALLAIGKYAPRLLPYFEVEKKWGVSTPLDCISQASSFYLTVLRSRKNDAISWYDVSISLLSKFKIEKDANIPPKVEKMLEHALSLTSVESLLSSIWTLLAEAKRLAEKPPQHQLHCLSRALQLNKANDTAWLKVAVLCIEVGLMNEASSVLEQTIKYNPHNADAWCAWAQHAHISGQAYDAMAMFRQALCIQPSSAAIVGYSSYLCDSLKKLNNRFDSATAALDFEPVIELRNQYPCSNAIDDDQILFHLGILADLFGWYPESLECFQLCQNIPCHVEIQRAQIKTNILYPDESTSLSEEIHSENSRLAGMLALSNDDNFAFLTAEMQVYGYLFQLIENNDAETFKQLYTKCVKGISVPLFISALIINKIDLPIEFIRTIHDALPRHELIDYFPTVLPEGMDNGLRHLEQDGEEPFRYRHRTAQRLLDCLKVLREKLDEEKPALQVSLDVEQI